MKMPLMSNNITRDDIDSIVKFLSQENIPILTNGKKVREFEKNWGEWLGTKYNVFVNSGSSANILTLSIIKYLYGNCEVITTPLGWVSDIAAILHAGLTPVFCDINKHTLAMDENEFEKKITPKTKVVLLTHILGYNGLTNKILELCKKHDLILIEDCCESHGATFNGKKVGSFGTISNFSFYYAHHMTSIEGGMICTNDELIYNLARSFRSHGMHREMDDMNLREQIIENNQDLNKDFIFLATAYNMRSTEINAVLALNQLKRLDDNNVIRSRNLKIFLDNLDSNKYFTDFNMEGNSNYAFTLLLNTPDMKLRDKVESILAGNGIEFRRGMSGGGNQLRQPYLKKIFNYAYQYYPENYPVCDYIHHYGWYIGNYPELPTNDILSLCKILNEI
jgi:CDP-4-dehydro-6-deoxyglucose reductase, E1